jgi:predicted transcriptional regulator
MNVQQNNWKVFSIVRRAGSVALADLVARCNLPPHELIWSLRCLAEEGLIDIQGEADTLEAVCTALDEVQPIDAEGPYCFCDKKVSESARANLFFALHDKYSRIGRVPVTPAP